MEKWTTPEPDTFSSSVPSFEFLETFPEVKHPVALPMLLPGTMVSVRTKNTLYRLTVVDGPRRQVSVIGGRLFPDSTDIRVLGALDGEDGVKDGWIVEGLPVQFVTPGGPVITSVVESVEVDVDPGTRSDEDTI
jgi:hypothetical protein